MCAEPRGGSQEDFEPVLKGYYNAIRGGKRKPAFPKKKRTKKADPIQSHTIDLPEEFKNDGAAFFAVCRGKVSYNIRFMKKFSTYRSICIMIIKSFLC